MWIGELAHLSGKVQDFLVPQAGAGDLCAWAVSRDTCCVLGHAVGFAFIRRFEGDGGQARKIKIPL